MLSKSIGAEACCTHAVRAAPISYGEYNSFAIEINIPRNNLKCKQQVKRNKKKIKIAASNGDHSF